MKFYFKRYQSKRIVILGFGQEGLSSYKFIRNLHPELELSIVDDNINKVKDYFAINPDQFVDILNLKSSEYQQLNQYDLVFRSPGIKAPLLAAIEPSKITSQTNEFLLTRANQTIMITATKGKSTTSSLIYALLKAFNQPVELVGNIGKPVLDLLLQNTDLDSNFWYVYETSSYQAENISVAPAVGMVLNLFEEHLDHYDGLAQYQAAKLRVISLPNQPLAVYGCDNQTLKTFVNQIRANEIQAFGHYQNRIDQTPGIYLDQENIIKLSKDESVTKILPANFKRLLKGEHNLINILAALTVIDKIMGLSDKNLTIIKQALSQFKNLAHRLEFVGTFQGIDFYNDSIATIPEATKMAISAIDNIGTVIIGGYDRKIDYTDLIDFLNQRPKLKLVCLPKTGHMIFDQLLTAKKYKVSDMESAVKKAFQSTDNGQACLLSPAAASYTFFKNFEDRGQQFKNLVVKFSK